MILKNVMNRLKNASAFYHNTTGSRSRIQFWLGIAWVALFILGLCIPVLFWWYISGSIYNAQDELEKSDYRFFWSNWKGEYTYIIEVPIHLTTNRILHLFPNDCIKSVYVNHKEITWLSGDLCNYRDWVVLDTRGYLQKGKNIIQVKIIETSWSRAFTLKPSIYDPVRMFNFLVLGLGLLFLLYYLFWHWFRFANKKQTYRFAAIVLWMYVIWLLFFIKSDYFQWSFDQSGHLDYLKLLLRWEFMPLSDACWQCYHPNIYYWFAEIIYKFGQLTARADPFELLRRITYCFWWIGIAYGFKTLYELFIVKKGSYLAFALACSIFAFWPLNFYFGARISNEVIQHLLSYMSIYFGLRARYAYQDEDDSALKKYSWMGIMICVAWLYIKTNSVVRLPIAWLGLIARLFRDGWRGIWKLLLAWKWYFISLFVINVILITGVIVMAKAKWVQGVVDNIDRINAWNSVAHVTSYEAFSTFHIVPFVTTSDMRKAPDDSERRSFRNFMTKTAILGEFGINKPKNLFFLSIYLISVLGVLVCMLYRFFVSTSRELFSIVWFFIPILAMMINRVLNPYASAMHYRFILPQIIFISYFSIYRLIEKKSLSEYKIIDYLQLIFITVFVVLSIAFSVPPYF